MLSKSILRLKIHFLFAKGVLLEHIKWNFAKKEFEPDNSVLFKMILFISHLIVFCTLVNILPDNYEKRNNQKAAIEIIGTFLILSFYNIYFYQTQQSQINVYNKIS